MQLLTRLMALLLALIWLPAVLHCELEGADVHFLTHSDHHHADQEHDHGTSAEDEPHAFDNHPYTNSAPVVKVLPPGDSPSVVLLALLATGREEATLNLSPDRHPPPLELKAAWQFIARAAPPVRAPSRST